VLVQDFVSGLACCVLVQDFVSGQTCCVNQYQYESW